LQGADVTVGHGSSTVPAGAIASLGSGIPFVYSNVGDPMYWGTSAARRARVRIFLRRARVVVALTSKTADALTERYAVPRRKIRVIPKGVPADRFPEVTISARKRGRSNLGIGAAAVVVTYVGALSAEKDPATAIRGVARLDDAHLIMAGDGPERVRLEQLAADTAPGRVWVLGAVSDPAHVYAVADVVVMSSKTEGLPGVLMEAGFSGLPAVTTDVGFVREIVRDGETGFVVSPEDPAALADALAEAVDARATLGPAARAHCLAHFEIGRIAEQWDELLTAVAAGTGP
jgi:glycosyltransferase involved in cell wall biosynthesis